SRPSGLQPSVHDPSRMLAVVRCSLPGAQARTREADGGAGHRDRRDGLAFDRLEEIPFLDLRVAEYVGEPRYGLRGQPSALRLLDELPAVELTRQLDDPRVDRLPERQSVDRGARECRVEDLPVAGCFMDPAGKRVPVTGDRRGD